VTRVNSIQAILIGTPDIRLDIELEWMSVGLGGKTQVFGWVSCLVLVSFFS
jgi:hypothetical protein